MNNDDQGGPDQGAPARRVRQRIEEDERDEEAESFHFVVEENDVDDDDFADEVEDDDDDDDDDDDEDDDAVVYVDDEDEVEDDQPAVPCTLSIEVATSVVQELRAAETLARAFATACDSVINCDGDVQQDGEVSDVYVLVYDVGTDTWTTELEIAEQPGRVYFARVQLLFARLNPLGQGLNEAGTESFACDRLKTFTLTPIARCYANVADSVAFIVGNALPTMQYALSTELGSLSAMHEAFDPSDDESNLGVMSRADVRTTVETNLGEVLGRLQRLSITDATVDVHSRKVQTLIEDDVAMHDDAHLFGTFNNHPTVPNLRGGPLWNDLEELSDFFADLRLNHRFTEIIDVMTVAETTKTHRNGKRADSLAGVQALPSRTAADADSLGLHVHQRVAVTQVLTKFADGLPGALLSLDVGLGKTLIQYAVTYIALKTEAVGGVTWVVEEFSTKRDAQGVVAVIADFVKCLEYWGEANPAEYVARVTVLKSAHQGAPTEVIRETLAIASEDGRDHLLIVDEAARYLGTVRKPSALVTTCGAHAGKIFRLAMTATPLTSVLDRVANVFIVLGARYAPMRNSGALACAREVLAEMVEAHVGGGEQVFEGQDTALADLKALIAQVCVGFDSICGDDAETSAAVDALIQRLGIERKVICYKADCPRTELVKKLVEGAKPGQKSKALECHELAPRMSFALHGSKELEAEWLASVAEDEETAATSPVADALIEFLEAERAQGRKCIVFWPSDHVAVMNYVYHEARGKMTSSHRMGIVDGSTKRTERAKLFESINKVQANQDDADVSTLQILFMSVETSAYGLNATNVHTAVMVGSPWTDSATVQAFGRVVRACANTNDDTTSKKLVEVIPIHESSGMMLRRWFRARARGQVFAQCFPGVVHNDRAQITLKHVFGRSAVSDAAMEAYKTNFGAPLYEAVFQEGADQEVVELEYNAFVAAVNQVIANVDGEQWGTTDLSFMVTAGSSARVDDNEEPTAEEDVAHGGPAAAGGAADGGEACEWWIADYRRVAARAFCTRESAKVPALVAPDQLQAGREWAERLKISVGEAFRRLGAGEDVYASKDAPNNDWWTTFSVDSPLRRQMMFASAYAKQSWISNHRSYFPTGNPQPAAGSEAALRIAYGVENERTAVEHVARKYALTLVDLDHTKKFTRIHVDEPRLLAGSCDAMTCEGVLLEIKCIRNRDAFLHRIAQGSSRALASYKDQVHALLEVFNLPMALLCYWHGAEADDEPDMSFEFPVVRDAAWWEKNKTKMRRAVQRQRRALRRAGQWNDDIMPRTR